MKLKGLAVLVLMASVLPISKASATDFVVEIDNIVVAIHDYSVLSGTLNSKMSINDMKSVVSKMNTNLAQIRKQIVRFDSDVSYNWKVLIDNDNVNYPHRQLLKEFDSNTFSWYNNEQQLQKKVNSCFKSKSAVSCVMSVRKAAKTQEIQKYSALTDTLDSIQAWRKQFNR
jgi:hypothetical protein